MNSTLGAALPSIAEQFVDSALDELYSNAVIDDWEEAFCLSEE